MKKNIVSFIMGAIIFSGITTLALSINSKDVSYKNTTVESAIDELYERVTAPENVTLWTNPSPASNFSATDITVSDSLANYSYIGVKVQRVNGGMQNIIYCRYEDLINSQFNMIIGYKKNSDQKSRSRAMYYVNDTTLHFTDTYDTADNGVVNNYHIPLEIIGIK